MILARRRLGNIGGSLGQRRHQQRQVECGVRAEAQLALARLWVNEAGAFRRHRHPVVDDEPVGREILGFIAELVGGKTTTVTRRAAQANR